MNHQDNSYMYTMYNFAKALQYYICEHNVWALSYYYTLGDYIQISRGQ